MAEWCLLMDSRRERAEERALERAMYIEGWDALQLADTLAAWACEDKELLSLR
jgi:hypothetical protein